jgi:LuxR family maltose regulon positive regulatory protein
VIESTLPTARPRIARPRLAERLRSALRRGPVILCAEAGFGKTSALEDAVADLPLVAWVRLSEADRDAGRLLLHLIDRLADVAPGAVDVLAERVAGPMPVDVSAATVDLVSELQRLLVDRLVIVIDDAELIATAAAALHVVKELLDGAGPAYGIAVATRTPLALKLAKLRTTGRLEELAAAELAFSTPECAELIAAQAGRAPEPAEVDEVMRATDGWPLGVALGVSVGSGSPPATRVRLFEFLEQEVLDAAPQSLRDRLLASSLLPELEPELLHAVGLGDGLVGEVQRSGLPLRRADGGAPSYQPLVREFLLDRLERSWPADRRREMHARVAAAMAAAGRSFEAVDHWLEAERFTEALGAVVAERPGLAATAPETVARWLDALPAGMRSTPEGRLLEGQLDWSRGRHEQAVAKLRAAVEGFRAEGNAVLEWSARFALCDPLAMTGHFEEMAALADGFDSAAAADAAIPAAATGFYGAMAFGSLGQVEAMNEVVARLLAHPAGTMFGSLRAAWEQFSHVPRGSFDELWPAVTEAIAEYERADPFSRLPHQLLVAALILMDQGRDDEAHEIWSRMEEVAASAHMPYLVSLARAERARVHVRAGRPDQAEEELARAGAIHSGWEGYAWELVHAGVAAQRGRATEAVAAAERAVARGASATVLERERIALEVVPILFDAGAVARAAAVVDEALELLDSRYRAEAGRYLRSLLLGLRASMRAAAGETEAAVAELRRAWGEAKPNEPALVRRLGGRLHRPLWAALELGAIAPEEAVRALERAWPGGDALVDFVGHPLPEVRRRAAASLAASGRPDVLARLSELGADPDPQVVAAAEAIRARLSADPPPLSFELFGGFTVRRGSWRPDDAAWERRIAQRLVRYLLTHRGSPASEDELIEAFWPDKSVQAARHSLHVALSSARRVLELPGAAGVVETGERAYRLRLRPRDSVDVDAFERAADAALAAPADERLELLERAASLWGGEPLPEERYSDWAIPWREALQDRYGAVLDALVQAYLRRGDLGAAIEAGRKLVALDELNEAAHRSLMLSYARAGRRAHALRQYLECRRILVAELAIEPAIETSELQRRILAGEAV